MTEKNLAKKAIVGTIWFSGLNYTGFVLNFAFNLILVRFLAPEDFGLFALASVIAEILLVFASWGFPQAIIQIRDKKHLDDTAYGLIILAAGFLVLLGVILSFILKNFYSDKLIIIFMLICTSRAFATVCSFYRGLLQRDFRYKALSIVNIISSNVSMILAVIMAIKGAGVWSLLARDILLVIFCYFGFRYVSGWRYKWHFNKETALCLLSFGCKKLVTRALEIISFRADRLLIGVLGDLSALGYYDRAKWLGEIGHSGITLGAVNVAYPLYCNLQKQQERLLRSYEIMQFFMIRIMAPICIIMFVFPEEIITILYGTKWLPSAEVIRWLSVYTFCYPIIENIAVFLMGIGKLSKVVKINLIQILFLVPCLIVGIKWYGFPGAAIALALSGIVSIISAYTYLKKYIPNLYLNMYTKPLLAGVLAVFGLQLSKNFFVPSDKIGIICSIAALLLFYIFALVAIDGKQLFVQLRFVFKKFRGNE